MQSSNPLDLAKLLAIAFTGLLCLILPLAGQLYCRKRGAHWRGFWAGAATFFVAALLLEQGVHTAVLTSPFGETIWGNLWLYALYGAAMAALFEETGRYITFGLMRRFLPSAWDSVSFGLGHGGCEAVLLVGFTMLSNLMILWSSAQGDLSPAVAQSAQLLAQLPASTFLWSGLERVSAMLLHVINSMLVYQAVRQYRRHYYLLALAFHFVLNFVTVLLQPFVSVAVLELAVLLLVLSMAAGGLYVLRPILCPQKPKEEQGWDDWLN